MPLHTKKWRGGNLWNPYFGKWERFGCPEWQRPCDWFSEWMRKTAISESFVKHSQELFSFFLMQNFTCSISTDFLISVQLVVFKFSELLSDISYLSVFKGNKHHYASHIILCYLVCIHSTFYTSENMFEKRHLEVGSAGRDMSSAKLDFSFGKPRP